VWHRASSASLSARILGLSTLHSSTSPRSLLAEFGPDAPPRELPAAPADCLAYCRRLARTHNENFPVLTRLLDPALVDPFAAVYAFCRWADDLADEPSRPREHAADQATVAGSAPAPSGQAPDAPLAGPSPLDTAHDSTSSRSRLGEARLALLAWWRDLTIAWHRGDPPTHPVFIALAEISKPRPLPLPLRPFLDLIDAFEQDQRVIRYDTWEQLIDYCGRSANPVGRLVLALGGVEDAGAAIDHGVPTARRHLFGKSDALCTALQLTNFWQDVRRDLLDRDRVYLPRTLTGLDDAALRDFIASPNDPEARVPFILALRPLVERTGELFEKSGDLHRLVPASIRTPVWLFHAGGRSTLRRIEAMGCTTLWKRPALSRFDKSILIARAFLRSRLGSKRRSDA